MGLAALACCSNNAPPVGGLLASPAGMALANSLLFLANQDGDELHVFDTGLQQFRPSPNLMFPLSVPTVRRPGAVCGNGIEMFTISSVDPMLGVIDAFDDPTNADPADPPLGLRELGEVALPGLASDAVCTAEPSAVLAHKKAVAGSPALYAQEVDAGPLILDADGGADERHAVADLPMAALLTFNDPDLTCPGGGCSGTQIWQATNDITGVACDAGMAGGTDVFCTSLQPLFALPPQPASCAPVGPPLALRVDVSGANAGDVNVGVPNVDPSTLNRMMAADQNSNCVASVNLDDMSVDWFYANGPSTGVFAMPYVKGSCLPGGDLFAAVFAGEQCERQGPPPVGGYANCGAVSFLSVGGGGLLPEPLPYPFIPRRPMPPVRIFDFVQRVAFIGPNVAVTATQDGLVTPVAFQMLAMVGTGSGDIVYVDIGIGRPDAGTGADDAGEFACPAAYLAPRLLDINDYITNPVPPEISEVSAVNLDGGPSLGEVTQVAAPVALTALGAALPTTDRLDAGFSTPLGTNGLAMTPLSCYALAIGSQICVTEGLMQKGVAEAETFVATYNGSLPGLAGIPGTLNGSSLQITSAGDLIQINGGLLSSEGADGGNLMVQLIDGSGDCGAYGISAVATGSLTLSSPPTCASGPVEATVVASNGKPFTVQGTTTGFLDQLWPMDGTLHLVIGKRWQYPANLIGMVHGAQQLADFVLGPIPAQAAPGSSLTFPRDGGADSDALDSSFGLALSGPLGIAAEPDAGTGLIVLDGGGEVAPLPGAYWSFNVSNGVFPLTVNPTAVQAADSLIDGMAAYTSLDAGGVLVPHVFASYRGGNAMVELIPTDGDPSDLYVFH